MQSALSVAKNTGMRDKGLGMKWQGKIRPLCFWHPKKYGSGGKKRYTEFKQKSLEDKLIYERTVGAFHGNLPHVANIDNCPATVLSRRSPLLRNSR
jgi:hypothetical protein